MKRLLKIVGAVIASILVLLLVAGAYVLVTWDRSVDREPPALTAPRDSATVQRGKYIFNVTWQCWSCHQGESGEGSMTLGGGMKFDLTNIGPGFGVYYSRNITPDSITGLGRWSDGEIVQAIREGVNRNRKVLFPIMPVDWLKDLSDDDALAIVAYIRSLRPMHNRVPDAEPSFFAKALKAFHVMGPTTPTVGPRPRPAVTAEYGRYFTLHVAGCADCHTPRNLQDGKFYLDSLLAGSSIAFGEAEHDPTTSYARNITPDDSTGIGRWTEEQFIAAVTGGQRPDGTVLTPHMPYAHYKFLAEDDLRAVYLFVRSLTPVRRITPRSGAGSPAASLRGAERGKMLYQSRCKSCHGPEGKGGVPTNVKLAEVAGSLSDAELKEFIAQGQLSLRMPAFGKTLSGEELDDVIAYLRQISRATTAPSN